jgi:hypothetical protein
MTDHDQRLRPDQPGRSNHQSGHRGPSAKAIANREKHVAERLARLDKAMNPDAFARRSEVRLRAALDVANRRAEGRRPG